MTNQTIPTYLLAITGIALIGIILYIDGDIAPETFSILPMEGVVETSSNSGVNPFFGSFREELEWYAKYDTNNTINTVDCDILRNGYATGDFDSKVAHAHRILEVCEL